jgi:hypothetical protein
MPIERIPPLLQLTENSPHFTVGCLVKPVVWSRPLSAATDGKLLNDPLLGQLAICLGGKLEHWAITFCCLNGATWEPWFTMEHLGDPPDHAKLTEGDCTFRKGTPIPSGGEIYCSVFALDEFQQLCDEVDEVYQLPYNHCQTFVTKVHNAFTEAMQAQPPGTQTHRICLHDPIDVILYCN